MSLRSLSVIPKRLPLVARVARTRHRRYATEAPEQPPKPSEFGQPVFQSHPHLVLPNELTPGIPAEEYERRRKELMDALPDGSLVVAVAAPVKYMSGQIFYKYRQYSDFWYLSGFEEPESAFILGPSLPLPPQTPTNTHPEKSPSTPRGYTFHLFSSGKDSSREKWEGARSSHSAIPSLFNASSAYPLASFAPTLKSLLASSSGHVYLSPPPPHNTSSRRSLSSRSPSLASALKSSKNLLAYLSSPLEKSKGEFDTVLEVITGSGGARDRTRDLGPEVGKLRNVKSIWEVGVMKRAAEISGRAHAKTMRFAAPNMPESSLAAHFEYMCALEGSQRPAYVPVVASGANALIIHYTSNNHLVREGEMLLVDAGCEYNGYASDITRTYPLSKFTQAQADLYSAILSVQKSLVASCSQKEGLSLNELHRRSVEGLRGELGRLGFNLGGKNSRGGNAGYGDLERVLYPHHLSHPIGIDLHESTHFDRNAPLKAGNVITIEPGIYVPPSPIFPKHFHNMGIRIEDEVLVGEDSPTVLTASAPKEIVDVEGACQGLLGFEPY
ncbi:hypothetical protein JAAARDRAFT_202334 [Jaapia argillacea MUCL 33604]|uniref:Aminopeptidase P N-terminal domain-containing protein n=1 Tax=Jaapia argillacea MUCL 33604 TaxID=933084 RepID=A0A067QDG2_9AGAM|nr:hypothetical protein JAAARDRAFT_202334 [Jaapia argillacea MUCL 33604]